MMKRIFIFTLINFSLYYCIAQNLQLDALYTYQMNCRVNNSTLSEEVVVFANLKESRSYCLSSVSYARVTITGKDAMQLAQYQSNYEERVYRKKNLFIVLKEVQNFKMKYAEEVNFNWTLLPATKKIGNILVQQAKTKAYGRTWVAWFAKDINVDIGPYKFAGLPGLIIELYDESGDFSFKLKLTKKKNHTIKLPNLNQYKTVTPSEFSQIDFRLATTPSDVVRYNSVEEKRDWQESLIREYNSLPRLDIRYPVK